MIPIAGSVVLSEVAEPTPADHEVVVAVEAYSVNRGETFLLESPPMGWRPGKDIAGAVVQEAASGVGPARGQRVVGHPESGGWAERVAVPTDRLAVLPDDVPARVAAALPLAGLTALRLTRVVAPLAGERVLLTGASGGVGHYFTELAAAQGAEVSAVVGSESRGTQLLRLGTRAVLTDIEQADRDYDVVIESVGGDVFNAAWRRLATRGLFGLDGAGRAAPDRARLLRLDRRDQRNVAEVPVFRRPRRCRRRPRHARAPGVPGPPAPRDRQHPRLAPDARRTESPAR